MSSFHKPPLYCKNLLQSAYGISAFGEYRVLIVLQLLDKAAAKRHKPGTAGASPKLRSFID